MNAIKASMIVLLAGLLAGVTACIHDSDADGNSAAGPTQAEFDQLKSRVAALEDQVASLNVVTVTAGAAAAGSGKQQKAAPAGLTCPQSGYAPASENPATAQVVYCQTDQGYSIGLHTAAAGASAHPPVPLPQRLQFDAPDCQGNAFYFNPIYRPVVFGYSNDNDARTGMIDPADGRQDFVSYSSLNHDGSCSNFGGLATQGYPVVENDPAVSGAEDAYPGPIY